MNNCVHHNPKPVGGNSPELVDFLPVLNLGALRKKIKVRMMLIDCTKLLGECLRNDRFGEKKNKRKKKEYQQLNQHSMGDVCSNACISGRYSSLINASFP